jgi:hypothetical protein
VRDVRTWPRQWNDAAIRRIAQRYNRTQSPRWPLFGMLALGLVAGAAVGGYAVSQRWRLKRLSEFANRVLDLRTETDMGAEEDTTIVAVPGSKLRRRATSEV